MKRGFTLIELLVAISIIAILSTIGLAIFSGIQSKGRDSVRKSDLKALATALELYYQKNGRYPCTSKHSFPTGWNLSSSSEAFWITDTSDCENQPLPLDVKYINQMPRDPQQNDFSLILVLIARGYTYWSGNGLALSCSENPGQNYILMTRLESTTDPDRHEIAQYKGCDNITPIVPTERAALVRQLYFLTSWK